jgi:predicted DCC family thiol-disulfide oxidoreductase YuxK
LKNLPVSGQPLDSVVLIENGRLYQQSTAALRILRHLGGAWPLLYGFIFLPAFFRDWVYAGIAKNRYRWFGRREACMLPTPALKARFL